MSACTFPTSHRIRTCFKSRDKGPGGPRLAALDGARHPLERLVEDPSRRREVEAHEALARLAEGAPVGEPHLRARQEELVRARLEAEGAAVEPREVGRLGWMVD